MAAGKSGKRSKTTKSARKTASKKAARKPAKKAAAKKTRPKKAAANKSPAKKTAAKKTAAKKPATPKAARKTSAPKAPARKTLVATAKGKAKPAQPKSAQPSIAPARAPARKALRRRPAHSPSLARTQPPRSRAARGATERTPTPGRSPAAKSGPSVKVLAAAVPGQGDILTGAALDFLAALHRTFDSRRLGLLARRRERQARWDAGEIPDFLHGTRHVRASGWRVGAPSDELLDRRVELITSVDPDAIAAGLVSGARAVVADFGDFSSPTWTNIIGGQVELKRRWTQATPVPLMAGLRGWHMPEAHLRVDGAEMSAALFDFGLAAFHGAAARLALGVTPAFYLPQLENHLEARLWSDVFRFCERRLALPRGAFRATVTIETFPAAFEMDEIIFELREHIAGLAISRAGLRFSAIKRLARQSPTVSGDATRRDGSFLDSCADLMVKTCHRRGVFAMGDISMQLPGADGALAAMDRDARAGHDGLRVAHPDMVAVARRAFEAVAAGPNQLDAAREDVSASREALARVPEELATRAALRDDIRLGARYIAEWLEGRGAAPIDGAIETATSADLRRARVWQAARRETSLDNGAAATTGQVADLIEAELARDKTAKGARADALRLFSELALAPDCEEFLTLSAYRMLP